MARLGEARRVLAGAAGWGEAWLGMARHGSAWQAWRGMAWLGWARHGVARLGEARLGRRGMARSGMARPGKANLGIITPPETVLEVQQQTVGLQGRHGGSDLSYRHLHD